jgi:hypothetical protein
LFQAVLIQAVLIQALRERAMATSIFLAKLLGPLLLLVGISVALTPRTFKTMASEVVHSVTLVYLFGLMDFAAGLAIVLVHNVWVADWRVLITLLGWLMLLRGIARTVATETVMQRAAGIIRRTQLYVVAAGVMIVIGLVLCYFGYLAKA